MKYICVEDGKVISALDYEPNVPSTVSVSVISDEDYLKLINGDFYFDVVTKNIVDRGNEFRQRQQIEKNNAQERDFLNSTDWMVLRHIRQKSLGISTSLTEQAYLDLEQRRQDSANRVIKINTD
jgi:hypothetical protein